MDDMELMNLHELPARTTTNEGEPTTSDSAEATASDSDEATTSYKRKRGVTMMKKLATKKDFQIEFDDDNLPIGEKISAQHSNWVGMETCSRNSILEPAWNKLDKQELHQLWLAIKTYFENSHWNIPNDDPKVETLKIANMAWKNFKKLLVREYVNTNTDPCKNYAVCFDEKTWKEFVARKTTPEFKAKSERGRENARRNTNPHRLGSRGYRGKIPQWEDGKSCNKLVLHNIASKRAQHFLLGRTVWGPSGEYVLPSELQPLADKIIEKDTQATQGTWIPEPGDNPLIAVLGPEHPGRTRGVGHTVGLRKGLVGLANKKRE